MSATCFWHVTKSLSCWLVNFQKNCQCPTCQTFYPLVVCQTVLIGSVTIIPFPPPIITATMISDFKLLGSQFTSNQPQKVYHGWSLQNSTPEIPPCDLTIFTWEALYCHMNSQTTTTYHPPPLSLPKLLDPTNQIKPKNQAKELQRSTTIIKIID